MTRYDNEDETVHLNLEVIIYQFEKSALYKYMKYSFQYVNPSLQNYGSKSKFILFQLGRAVMALLIWLIIIFGIFYTAETNNIKNIRVTLLSRIIGITWQFFNYNLGLYLFYKYPFKVQIELKEIEELCETDESKSKMKERIRCLSMQMRNYTIVSFITFAMLRLITAIIYLSVDGKISLCSLMWIGAGVYRALCLPFLLFFMFFVKLQAIKVDRFTETLESKDLVQQKGDLIKTHLSICRSIKNAAKQYQPFIIFLVVFLCLNCLRITSVVSTNFTMIKKRTQQQSSAMIYHVTGTIEALLDIILYAVVLFKASKVSHSQKQTLPAILNRKNENYNTLFDLVNVLKMRHDLEGLGYNIYGIPITGIKALLFSAFVTIFGAIAQYVFFEGAKGTCFAFTL